MRCLRQYTRLMSITPEFGLHECAPGITLVANGEIVSYATAQECAAKSGCDVLMTGRAALSVPNLGAVIKHQAVPFDSEQMLQVLLELIEEFERCSFAEKSILDRIKQFMGFARLQNAAVGAFFRTFCKVTSLPEALQALKDWPAFIAAQTEISSATSNSVAETVSAPAAAEA